MRILLAQINPIIGDLKGNTDLILKGIEHAKKNSADIVVFPELALTGYPPEDFLLLPHFISALEVHLEKIQAATKGLIAIVGTPRREGNAPGAYLYNSAAIYHDGKLLGYQDKSLLPTYDVFDESRYFEPAATLKPWIINDKRIAVTICEDIWQHSNLLKNKTYPRDPVLDLSYYKPVVLINISASPFSTRKSKTRLSVGMRAAKTLGCPVLLCNQVGGNDGIIFDGNSYAVNAKGQLIALANKFEEDYLLVDLEKEPDPINPHIDFIKDLYNALVLGVRDYFHKSGFTRACLGLSGGIDSALVACIAAEALGKENVLGVGMPSRYSSEGSITDSIQLAKSLGIQYMEIPIEGPFKEYLELLTPHFEGRPKDVTEENLQARIRGMILMALSNKMGYIVLSTGNKSELAMGYATLYGDMCGGLGVISDVTKGQVYALVQYINQEREIIPKSTIEKPPSAELRENQKDSDSLPDYDIIDNVLQAYVEEHSSPEQIAASFNYPIDLVNQLVKRIHNNEYKRRQSPPGLRISEKAFSTGRRFPIVQQWI